MKASKETLNRVTEKLKPIIQEDNIAKIIKKLKTDAECDFFIQSLDIHELYDEEGINALVSMIAKQRKKCHGKGKYLKKVEAMRSLYISGKKAVNAVREKIASITTPTKIESCQKVVFCLLETAEEYEYFLDFCDRLNPKTDTDLMAIAVSINDARQKSQGDEDYLKDLQDSQVQRSMRMLSLNKEEFVEELKKDMDLLGKAEYVLEASNIFRTLSYEDKHKTLLNMADNQHPLLPLYEKMAKMFVVTDNKCQYVQIGTTVTVELPKLIAEGDLIALEGKGLGTTCIVREACWVKGKLGLKDDKGRITLLKKKPILGVVTHIWYTFALRNKKDKKEQTEQKNSKS